ncbi:VOC family protein [Pasteurellaceae bacterium USgator11]|nr:VOC family protein [Pasteurellaceae bacterium UScroc12]TNG98096.1 VOC family protein [Pasteurellaceae bacterium USgator41]TNG99041.1 VOC family protein [Pasteurellaceae bacterium UScroc31]TNG99873.1 VOC family protein [Pasteurellaceae bacterium USgator11]
MNRINLIALGVKDVAKSMRFYQALGFITHEPRQNPPIVFFDNQGTKLELFSLEDLAKDINAENPPPITNSGFGGITFAINMKSKTEVDDFFAKLETMGAAIAKTPQWVDWGGYSGYFQDLDGYYWEVAYADSWQFDDNDMLIIDESSGIV